MKSPVPNPRVVEEETFGEGVELLLSAVVDCLEETKAALQEATGGQVSKTFDPPPTAGRLHAPLSHATTLCSWSPLSLSRFLSLSLSLSL